MLLFISFTIALLLVYSFLIGYYRKWWIAIPEWEEKNASNSLAPPTVTVIIPARNEETNIVACLQSLMAQQYPTDLLEIIVIDDHSTDNTAARVRSMNIPNLRLIHLSDFVKNSINSYKKKAIEIAIAESSGELIITTDADCETGPLWIHHLASYYLHNQAVFIAAGVRIKPGKSLLSRFQSLDFLTLQGITGASVHKRFHSMCNGANMAYTRKVFYEVGGFQGIDTIASGDDMLLMHKVFKRYPERVFFLKSQEAIVTTGAQESWSSFFNQRIRWASKATVYQDRSIFYVLLLVYLLNCSLLFMMIGAFIIPGWWVYTLSLVFLKALAEIPFVYQVAGFFRLQQLLPYFLFFQPLHIFYTVVAGFLGKFGAYKWKDRKVK